MVVWRECDDDKGFAVVVDPAVVVVEVGADATGDSPLGSLAATGVALLAFVSGGV